MKVIFDLDEKGNSITATPESLSLHNTDTGIALVFAGMPVLQFKGKLEPFVEEPVESLEKE